ncbi:MAG: SipW-dependent-type signal peptide-containing protein [Clostridia bacterium]|nr:SipW-dependent-type signal peptide-containing protein [Clostridia bacterium]
MNKKKVAILMLSLCVVAAIAVTGTIAYFTDTDSETNVFTVGKVDIELLESTLHREVDNATDDQIIADAGEDNANYLEYLKEAGKDMAPGIWVRKAPYIKNIGINNAYVRLRVRFADAYWNLIDVMQTTTAIDDGSVVWNNGVHNDEEKYTEYTITYTKALKANDMTYWPAFWQFKLQDQLDNKDVAHLRDENGAIELKIEVFADAIQADGFDTAAEAFIAYDAQVK